MKTQTTLCFAYFGDGRFLGWYADTFGSLRPTSPKLYSHTPKLLATIEANFEYKLSKLKQESKLAALPSCDGLELLDASLNKDKTNLSQYSKIELRYCRCPFYDGPNPNYDKAKFEEWYLKEKADKGTAKFSDCPKELANWTYADYDKVKEWASNEPTEFLGYFAFNND